MSENCFGCEFFDVEGSTLEPYGAGSIGGECEKPKESKREGFFWVDSVPHCPLFQKSKYMKLPKDLVNELHRRAEARSYRPSPGVKPMRFGRKD